MQLLFFCEKRTQAEIVYLFRYNKNNKIEHREEGTYAD
ncbi:hypothetical protein SD77_3710 [Bacillus badius]|uniref:Mobile element protein n=1 Tax=Bacillus badius TaxID=1455 RepID=A0ABR5AW85_BACBA|nr:hypothetical protein SD77_3710 [Bacillus badius]